MAASANLARARREAREFGEARRKEIHKRAVQYKDPKAKDDDKVSS